MPAGGAHASGREEPAAAKKLVRKLGKQKVANMFTHLRKIAQHPLLVRRLFNDEAVAKMASLAHARYCTPELPHCCQSSRRFLKS